MEKPILAIMYDFDKTLSTTDMQDYTFIPKMGYEKAEDFWKETEEFANKNHVERILSYMYMMVQKAKENNIPLTKKFLNDCGKNIEFLPGVTTWFKRITDYAEEKGVKVEHYLVSSGTLEIVEGCKIFDEFTKAFGCEFYYNDEGIAVWPKLAINYTQKTQFFYRIAKGVNSIIDDAAVNEKSHKLRIPYKNIVYIGDGMTDIACMTLIKKSGGTSVAVYRDEITKEKVTQIYNDERVSFIAKTDYTKGSRMEKVFKMIIDNLSARHSLDQEIAKMNNAEVPTK